MSSGQSMSAQEAKALTLLGQNLDPQVVAGAVGLSISRISQLLANPDFVEQIAEARYQNLQEHNLRDRKYDTLEDRLLEMMENCLPFMEHKPWMIMKAITTLNSANRRGVSAPASLEKQAEVVTLNIPVTIKHKYVLNINQQVVQAGDQDLVTIQSSQMNKMLTAARAVPKELEYETTHSQRGP